MTKKYMIKDIDGNEIDVRDTPLPTKMLEGKDEETFAAEVAQKEDSGDYGEPKKITGFKSNQFELLNDHFQRIDKKINNDLLDAIEKQFENTTAAFNAIKPAMASMREFLKKVEEHLIRIDGHVNKLEDRINELENKTNKRH